MALTEFKKEESFIDNAGLKKVFIKQKNTGTFLFCPLCLYHYYANNGNKISKYISQTNFRSLIE
jgi:hypothetical protein